MPGINRQKTKAQLEYENTHLKNREYALEQALAAAMENRTVYLGFSTSNPLTGGGGHAMHRYFGVPGTDLLLVSGVSYSGAYMPYYSGLAGWRSDTPQHVLDRLEALKKEGWERGE